MNKSIKDILLSSKDPMDKDIAEGKAWSIEQTMAQEHKEGDESKTRFNCLSLGDWLEACRRTNVPFVPAYQTASLRKKDALLFEVEGEHQKRLEDAFVKTQSEAIGVDMVRFDFCAPLEIKAALANGNWGWREEFRDLTLGDPRVVDIMLEYPGDSIALWKRPWIEALIEDDYPVEYRVFVKDGKIIGISNYYPQRTLSYRPQDIDAVRSYTKRLIKVLEPPFLYPQTLWTDELSRESVNFTADYILSRDYGIMFLEGGPPHELGAHPCCFAPGQIKGIALAQAR